MDEIKLKAELFQKLLRVMSAVERVTKTGRNEGQGYQYTTEADLVEALRGELIKNKVLILTSSSTKEVFKLPKWDKYNNKDKETLVSIVNTKHIFADTETGFTYEIEGTGSGWDDTDKGIFKAITGAMKYFMMKNFMVATEDDPENDGANPSYIRKNVQTRKTFSPPANKPTEKDTENMSTKKELLAEKTPEEKNMFARPKQEIEQKPEVRQEPETEVKKSFMRKQFIGHAGESKSPKF